MYLHIGAGVSVRSDRIIGIFDIENSTVGDATRSFLKKAEEENEITYVSPEMPRSFILAEGTGGFDVYVSPISAVSIRQRMDAGKAESIQKKNLQRGK